MNEERHEFVFYYGIKLRNKFLHKTPKTVPMGGNDGHYTNKKKTDDDGKKKPKKSNKSGNNKKKREQINYVLAWHIVRHPSGPIIFTYTGWWHGNNSVSRRLIADSATVIILGNKFNRNIWTAGKMSSVFTGHADTTRLEPLDEDGRGTRF